MSPQPPFAGIRVLDMSRVLAGPWAAQILADFGADVIKIERPGAGDDSRSFGPPFFKDLEGRDTQRTAMFHSANRNKRAMTINVATPEGQALVRRLAATADVLIENYKVGALARYGLGWDDLHALNPRLIYCSVTGYGQTGPYRDRGGYDPVAQAAAGIMSVTGLPEEEPGGGPMKAGPSITDLAAGFYAGQAIMAALYARDQGDGQGRYIDISLLDTAVALMAHPAGTYFATGKPPGLVGTQANGGAPGGGFRCVDGYIMIAPGSQQLYRAFCHALEMPELADDPRFVTNSLRVQNRRELMALLNTKMGAMPVAEVHRRMVEAGVPSSPVNDVAQVFDDPHVQHRGLEQRVPHPRVGEVRLVANPIKASGGLVAEPVAPPDLGAHTREILENELGLSAEEIDKLARDGVI